MAFSDSRQIVTAYKARTPLDLVDPDRVFTATNPLSGLKVAQTRSGVPEVMMSMAAPVFSKVSTMHEYIPWPGCCK